MATNPSSQLAVAASLLVALLSAGSLLVGAEYLAFLLPGGLPFGNVLAAAVFFGIAGAAALLAPADHWSRPVALAALVGSVAWLPLSIALAGNASLNFSGQRGLVWVWLSGGLFFFALAALLLAAVASFLARRRQGCAA